MPVASVRLLALALLTLAASRTSAEPIDFEKRVAAQKAIEEVYRRHRTWPKENPQPKPPRSAVLSEEAIRVRVEDYLKKSNALATLWQRPVGHGQLQAEMDRIATHTRDPERLRELYAALGNDGALIAETLLRPALVDRLIRKAYASDERYHGALSRRAAAALAEASTVEGMTSMGGEYSVSTYTRDSEGAAPQRRDVVELAPDAYGKWEEELARRFRTPVADLPARRLSELHEDEDGFSVIAVLSREADRATVASVVWRKRPFDEWWSEAKVGTTAALDTTAEAYAVTAPHGTSCTDDTWDLRFFAPAAGDNYTAVWTGTEMIVWGGHQSGKYSNSGGRYDPSTDAWTPTSRGANVPTGRHRHTAVWTGTEMVVWGGFLGSSDVNSGGRYNPSTDTWTPTSTGANVPSGRELHSAVWTGTEMIVWGGEGFGSFNNTGGRYSPSTNTWTATSTGANVPSSRSEHTAVWTGTEMIVWSGRISGALSNTGGRYSPASDSWSPTSTGANVPSARRYHTAVWTGTAMIVWGGEPSGGSVNTGARYAPSSDTWTATSTDANVPAARRFHTANWTGSEMVVLGGATSSGTVMSSGGRYNPVSNAWTPTSTDASVPSGRERHVAVWTGTEVIVWGGLSNGYLSTGGRYDPVSDAWTPIPAGASVPQSRRNPTAVWTGAEMIVWGGTAGSYEVNTGGRYDPALDSWTPTSTGANVPRSRSQHAAVWTGTEMIVWGGSSFSVQNDNSGGRYNPTTDAWTPMLGTSPSGRSRHTAVWTGTEMIVWGGYSTVANPPITTYFASGGRYDPALDSWTPTSTGANVPAGRVGHTAVWTGSRMVVWGGQSAAGHFNTGGQYSSASNTWIATSTAGPSARTDHSAVWTGTEMIVWGGSNPTNYFANGGRYNPVSDTWAATSTGAAVPSARSRHGAHWTGSQMIVWGGVGGNGSVVTGGRYEPELDTWTATAISTGTLGPPQFSLFAASVWAAPRMMVWGDSYHSSLWLYCSTCASPAPEICNGLDDDCDGNFDEDAQGVDTDGDEVRNVCDVCPLEFDRAQTDFDHDGDGDACDLDDGLIYVYFTSKIGRDWQLETGYDAWNSYIGSLSVLRATGEYTQIPGGNPLVARECGLTDPNVSDSVVPDSGEVAFNLVTGVTGGVESGLGTNRQGTPRENAHPCP